MANAGNHLNGIKIMKKIKSYASFLLLLSLLFSCAKERREIEGEENAKLQLFASFKTMTKLAELPIDQINQDNKGFKNIGLYIYYSSDYNAGVVTKPYIRNMECKLAGNMIESLDGSPIYIYDEMTIVAFYPYNAAAPNFTTVADEQVYPISMGDYSAQTYIPYRAQTAINPTVAYKTTLNFIPKQTVKIEVVIVGGTTFTNPQILPNVDPMNAPPGEDKREQMVDRTTPFVNTGGGQSVTQFVSYIWTSNQNDLHHDNSKHFNNIINKDDIIFQSDELTLTATSTINFSEDRVFRYGYNMVTGEVFIPTSSKLVYDIASLRASPAGYQVCDIDLSSIPNWTPINVGGQTFDGGGHKISGLTITSLPLGGSVGLFGQVQGNANLKNINLVSPQININAGNSVANVGALCGVNNFQLILTSDQIAAMRQEIINSLPANVAAPVIDALLQDAVKKATSGTPTISGCRVSNASITLNGKSLKAGLFCGVNGNPNASANITDCYATGTINANIGQGIQNDTCFVSGFVGYNNANIIRSYTTATANAETYQSSPITLINKAAGFCNLGSSYAANTGAVTNCFTTQANTTPSVPQFINSWPTWSIYTGKWPVYNTNVYLWQSLGSRATSKYPMLVWER